MASFLHYPSIKKNRRTLLKDTMSDGFFTRFKHAAGLSHAGTDLLDNIYAENPVVIVFLLGRA